MLAAVGGGKSVIGGPGAKEDDSLGSPFDQKAGYLKPAVILSSSPGLFARNKETSTLTATPEASATGSISESGSEPAPAAGPPFNVYTVQPGDTVTSIAARFGLKPEYISWNNPEVGRDPDYLIVGQQVLVPSQDGIVYTIKLGDTLSDIADFFGIDVQLITSVSGNGIASPDQVSEGMVLLLPGAVPPPPPPPAPTPVSPRITIAAAESPSSSSGSATASASGLLWPFYGSISSYFGDGRGHQGIDIDGFGRYGAPVVAAAAGRVVLAGWDSGGLGYRIMISHANGLSTVYAHLSEIGVGLGQYVEQGEIIGAIGCTGYCTGPHLHFEVHVNGAVVDPLSYLS